ncbi:hypothetical protein CC78DRAFT_547106 [Lojkania enalia]|uniref:BZIP domain-containing protein n=1 Tax=Lojkania enalia TaxID=147567 RepID=A0A9P4N020_9PLEO|nr:hypothetical protein CC78DRAFT_547106 [Didymosphaeria enalia]
MLPRPRLATIGMAVSVFQPWGQSAHSTALLTGRDSLAALLIQLPVAGTSAVALKRKGGRHQGAFWSIASLHESPLHPRDRCAQRHPRRCLAVREVSTLDLVERPRFWRLAVPLPVSLRRRALHTQPTQPTQPILAGHRRIPSGSHVLTRGSSPDRPRTSARSAGDDRHPNSRAAERVVRDWPQNYSSRSLERSRSSNPTSPPIMAATATRPSSNSSQTNSRMSSPKDSKKSIANVTKVEDSPAKVERSAQEQPEATIDEKPLADAKPATTNAPLAPPPRPSQNPSTTGDTPDYFNTVHNPFSLEPNVFEQSFGNPSGETPGRTILPPVANITSPSPLPGITPGWQSLRSGPLSPAMLTGPTNQTDYFSESFRGFPTPNESSLRTGLTPGGGGSMFPAPSPNTQALFNLQSGGVTPSTAEFQQSALRAAQQAQAKFPATSAPTSQPEAPTAPVEQRDNMQQQRGQNDPFANHDVSNAANDLLSFATQNGNRNNGQAFPMQNQAPQQVNNVGHMPVQPVVQEKGRRNTKGSINSVQSADTADFSESGGSEHARTATRSRAAKKGPANGKGGNKRKADEPPKSGKKAKGNNGAAQAMEDEEDESDEDTKMDGENNKKMTDEEKRKNFLERNRIAALKCRQRKKQWLANLQAKVELFSTENDALSATVTQLREEIVNLKTLLLAHKDCPVSQAQGLSGMNMNSFLGGDIANHQNPYGIAQMQPNGVHMGVPMQAGTQMQNRFVYPAPRMLKAEDEENLNITQNQYLQASS